MFSLNLLPPREIKKLEMTHFSKLLGFFSLWLAFFLVVFTLFLISTIFSISIILKSQNELIEIRNNDEQTQQLIEIENKTKQLNKYLDQIYIKQNELIFWTPILEELSEIAPSEVYIIDLSYQKSTNKVSLVGFASTRDRLLVFQDRLSKASCFTEIEAPLSNLIKQSDIDFIFTMKPIACLLSEDSN